jgi:FAD/FMN-containing dehydrogenase
MSLQPDLVQFIDVDKIGAEYLLTTPDMLPLSIFSKTLALGEVASITVRVTKRSTDSTTAFCYFDFTNVFMNDAGVIKKRTQDDTIILRGAPFLSKAYFNVVGANVQVLCESGFNTPCKWSAMVAVNSF